MKTMACETWKADGINLTAICVAAEWHLATAIAELEEAGFSRADAAAFAGFVFNEAAIQSGGLVDQASDDFVAEEQWERLEI
uniref:Uncharacterized protein n=1 Tax=viral metagenome TaxID=1070528 RepID=A0A6M3L6X8_9ZZZZ